jgi:hypothetical protein
VVRLPRIGLEVVTDSDILDSRSFPLFLIAAGELAAAYHPAGAKARIHLAASMARLKSCPDTKLVLAD